MFTNETTLIQNKHTYKQQVVVKIKTCDQNVTKSFQQACMFINMETVISFKEKLYPPKEISILARQPFYTETVLTLVGTPPQPKSG